MDPFTPIQVDPDPEDRSPAQPDQAPGQEAVPSGKPDPADVALAAAQNLFILGVIEKQINPEAVQAADAAGPVGQPIAVVSDPLADRDAPDGDPAAGGDGCLAAAFALLLTLSLAAGTAVAALR